MKKCRGVKCMCIIKPKVDFALKKAIEKLGIISLDREERELYEGELNSKLNWIKR